MQCVNRYRYNSRQFRFSLAPLAVLVPSSRSRRPSPPLRNHGVTMLCAAWPNSLYRSCRQVLELLTENVVSSALPTVTSNVRRLWNINEWTKKRAHPTTCSTEKWTNRMINVTNAGEQDRHKVGKGNQIRAADRERSHCSSQKGKRRRNASQCPV